MGYGLGDFSSQLSIADRNRAAQSVGSVGSAGGDMSGSGWADASRAAQTARVPQRQDGWGQTQRYMGALGSLGQKDEKGGNSLGKVLGLVGAFL